MKRMATKVGRFALLTIACLVLLIGVGIALVRSHHDATSSPVTSPTPWPTPTSVLNVNTPASHIYTYMCEYPKSHKPDSIYFACADGNTGISDIHWSTWTPRSAQGTGTYFANDCKPYCAAGKFSYTHVSLRLDTPIQMGPDIYLTQLSYQQIDSTGRNVKDGLTGTNDMASMYIQMNLSNTTPAHPATPNK